MSKRKKYQFAGGTDTDFFNQLVDTYAANYNTDQQPTDYQQADVQQVPQDDSGDYDYGNLQEQYDALQSQYEELSNKVNSFQGQNFQDDNFLNFLFSDSDNKMPVEFSNEELGYPSSKSAGLNPNLVTANKDIFNNYDVTNLGAWGEASHQSRQSDHNTGDAQDYGIPDEETANNLISDLQTNAEKDKVKYIIYNKKIWNPSISNEWRPYTGSNPHTDHVHVSYNRQYGGAPTATSQEDLYNGLNDPYYAQFGELNMNLPPQYNMVRGLDNGTPVYAQDEFGNSAILKGKHDKKYFFGKVKEKLL